MSGIVGMRLRLRCDAFKATAYELYMYRRLIAASIRQFAIYFSLLEMK